ncbi:hypothetical protein HPB52_016537 [Rhipicephalus sanguineus]|uniref:Protein FAM122A n=1 Tax=Rhipicephalus sanguineus TaxID=34632 RepID=A0A9D4T0R8_RHISA|nr:hypothetical protein HPB52_016537 [Rhipicephalus sanguineus]
MDVDPPPPLGTGSNLKRSSSAPMINVLGNTPTFREALSPLVLSIPRTRRFSASFSPNHSPSSPLAAVPSRVSQIKQEEGMDVMIRETAHEKEVQSKLQISQSWDDLTLGDGCLGDGGKRPRSLTDPLHIFTPPPGICNSPSPTRAGKPKSYKEGICNKSSLEAMSSPEQTVPQDMGDSLSSSSGSPGCPSVFHQHHQSSSSGVRSPLAPVVSIDSPCNMEDS